MVVTSNIDYSKGGEFDNELPSNILYMEDAEEVADIKAYKLRDIYFPGKEGFINYTLSITNLRAGQQTRGHSHSDNVELCRIEKGDCFVVLDGTATRVKSGAIILVGKTVHHKIINASTTEDVVFASYFPGHLVREGFIRKRK